MSEDALELYIPESDLKPHIEKEIRNRIIQEQGVQLCLKYPQAFALWPIEQSPEELGRWGKYPFDESFNLWINSSHPEALSFYKKIITEEKEAIMSQELTKKEEVGIKQMLAANMKAIKTVLPKHMTPERMMRIAFTAISRSPGLARCTPISLLNAVIEASMLGLEVNSPLEQAVMVPFWNGKTKQFEAQLIPEYKGKIELAYRSGMVRSFQAHPVFEADEFHYQYGLNPTLTHIPTKKGDRGKLVAAYAVANYHGGGFDFEVIEEADAMSAKSRSESAQKDEKNKTQYSAWNTGDEPSMWVKTAVHQLFKRVPKSPEYIQLARAQELSAKAEAGVLQDFDWLDAEPVGSSGSLTDGLDPTGQGTPTASETKIEEKQREEGDPAAKVGNSEASSPSSEGRSTGITKPDASPQTSYVAQAKALFKSSPKVFYQACQESQIETKAAVEVEIAALAVMKKANQISTRSKK